MIKWHVILSKSDRKKIKIVLRSKKMSMETKKRAQILLDVDETDGRTPDSISAIMKKRGVSTNTVSETRRKFSENGIDAALFRKKRQTPPTAPKVTGEIEAHIIAVACSAAPEGFSRWSMKMIADKIVLDGIINTISDETVRLVLKKHGLSRT
jgi:transposase